MADVDVEFAVVVHIRERDPCGPAIALADARFLRDVAELEVTEVEVELRGVLVGCKHDLGQPVSGEVADRDAATVVKVAVGEDVEVAGLGEAILEVYPGIARRQEGKQLSARGGKGADSRFVSEQLLANAMR